MSIDPFLQFITLHLLGDDTIDPPPKKWTKD